MSRLGCEVGIAEALCSIKQLCIPRWILVENIEGYSGFTLESLLSLIPEGERHFKTLQKRDYLRSGGKKGNTQQHSEALAREGVFVAIELRHLFIYTYHGSKPSWGPLSYNDVDGVRLHQLLSKRRGKVLADDPSQIFNLLDSKEQKDVEMGAQMMYDLVHGIGMKRIVRTQVIQDAFAAAVTDEMKVGGANFGAIQKDGEGIDLGSIDVSETVNQARQRMPLLSALLE